MEKCVKLRRRNRKPVVGDMNQRIAIIARSITPPDHGDAEFDQTLSVAGSNNTVWAMVETADGSEIFDGLDISRAHTHTVYTRFDELWFPVAGPDSSYMLQLEDERLVDVLRIENLDNRRRFIKIYCSERGDKDLAGAQL